MTVEPLPDHIPRAAIRKRFLPGADILSGRLSGLRQFGTQHGGDNVFLALNIEGESAARERDREVTVRSGDAVLFSGANGGCTINRPTPVHFAAMRIPYRALAPLVANLDDGADAADTEGNRLASAARNLPPRDRHGARPRTRRSFVRRLCRTFTISSP